MLYRIIRAVLIIMGYAAWFILGRITGKRIGKRLGFKEGVEAVKIVHCEAIKADSDYCKKELEKVFAEIDSCIDYIEEQLDEVPDCFDSLKRDIKHIKSQTLAIERMKIIDLLATVERLSNVCKLNDKVGEDYIRISKENRDLKEMLIKEHYDTEERTVRRIQEALRERIKGVYLDEGEMCAIIDEVAEGILESEGKSGG